MQTENDSDDRPLDLFSIPFHRDFFLPFIINSINARKSNTSTHFADFFPYEYVVLFMITMTGVVTGIYAYLSEGSVFGGITGLLASAGFAALMVFSIRSRSDREILWKRFMITTFMFFMLAGLSLGLYTGMLVFNSFLSKFIFGIAGMIAGYFVGIPAGLYMQSFGWTGQLINIIMIPVMIGLCIIDIVVLII